MNVRSFIKKFFYKETNYYLRYKDGDNDLTKSISKVPNISNEQEKEILAFWKPYLNNRWAKLAFDIKWFNVYNKANLFGYQLKYYIPDSFYYCIVDTYFSDIRKSRILDDKNMYDLYFYDVNQPKTICRVQDGLFLDANYNIISEDEAIRLCEANKNIIIKPTLDACAGSGISIWRFSTSSVVDLRKKLRAKPSLIVQAVIQQHKVFADFCDTCVNTLRLVTLIFEGRVHLCTAVLIMGGKGAVTNHLHRGGIVCGIQPSGQLMPIAFDGKLNRYEKHPNGIVFSDCRIPNYDKCVDLVKRLAPRFSETTKLIGWDLTIDEYGAPVLIEPNLSWGGLVQIAAGPVFGDLTPKVLDQILEKVRPML